MSSIRCEMKMWSALVAQALRNAVEVFALAAGERRVARPDEDFCVHGECLGYLDDLLLGAIESLPIVAEGLIGVETCSGLGFFRNSRQWIFRVTESKLSCPRKIFSSTERSGKQATC